MAMVPVLSLSKSSVQRGVGKPGLSPYLCQNLYHTERYITMVQPRPALASFLFCQ